MDRREFVLLAAATPFTARRLLAPRAPRALVTCDTESRLAVVDLGSLRVVGQIATPPDPRAVERVGGHAVVCHTGEGVVSIVRPGGASRIVRGFAEPRYVAAHPDGRHAFVTESGRSSVAALDLVNGEVVGRVRLTEWARHLTIDRTGTRLWVGLGSASEHVAVVRVHPFRHAATLTPGFRAHDVGCAPDGRLWVTSGDAGTLAVGSARLAADAAPQHVTFGSGRAYVTSGDSGTFHVQAHDGRVLRRTGIPVGSYNVQYGDGLVITPSLARGTLAVLDAHGRLRGVVDVAGSCHDACFAP